MPRPPADAVRRSRHKLSTLNVKKAAAAAFFVGCASLSGAPVYRVRQFIGCASLSGAPVYRVPGMALFDPLWGREDDWEGEVLYPPGKGKD
jgi:hypothetical protein